MAAAAVVANRQNGGVIATDRCTCCPYGYHIDLDFLRFLDTLYSGDTLHNIRRVRHNRVNHSQSYDGFFSDDEVTRWRNYAASPPPLSRDVRPLSPICQGDQRVTTDEILLEIDTSISKTLYNIDDVDARVVRKKKPAARPSASVSENGFDTLEQQQRVSELSTSVITTTTLSDSCEMSPELASCFSGLMSQQTDVGTLHALQSIRDQMLLSLQRMRQLEQRVHVIPVLESELDRLRQENERLRQMCGQQPQQQQQQHQLFVNSTEVHTFCDSRGSVLVELPLSVTDNVNTSGARVRSIGVGDNDVYGNNIDTLFHEVKSKRLEKEARTNMHESMAEARRQFFWGSDPDTNPPTASGGWVGRVYAGVRPTRTIGVGDESVWEQQKTTLRSKPPVSESPVARVNLRVTVSEERLTSEPRWEVERFGSGHFQHVAVQCQIIGGRLLSHWRHSADCYELPDRYTPIDAMSGGCSGRRHNEVIVTAGPNHDLIEESVIREDRARQSYAVWDAKLAQLLHTEPAGERTQAPVSEPETVLHHQSQSANSFDWNTALTKLDGGSNEQVVDVIQETLVAPVYRQPQQPDNWQTRLERIHQKPQHDAGQQQQQQPFAPYLSPIRASSSIDDIDIDELTNRELENYDWQIDTNVSRSPLSSLTAASPASPTQLTSPLQMTSPVNNEHEQHDATTSTSRQLSATAAPGCHVDVSGNATDTEHVTNDVSMRNVVMSTVTETSDVTTASSSAATTTVIITSTTQTTCQSAQLDAESQSQSADDAAHDLHVQTSDDCTASLVALPSDQKEHVVVENSQAVVDSQLKFLETNIDSCAEVAGTSLPTRELEGDSGQQCMSTSCVSVSVTETNIDADLPTTLAPASEIMSAEGGLTVDEEQMKSCRIIITETRVDRQLIGSQAAQAESGQAGSAADGQADQPVIQSDVEGGANHAEPAREGDDMSTVETENFRFTNQQHLQHDVVTTISANIASDDSTKFDFEQRGDDLSAEMLEACSVYARWLVDSSSVTLDNKKSSVDVIQKHWFATAGRKSSVGTEVAAYLSAFERIHLPLLFAVVNMTDHDMNTVLHYAVSHGNIGVIETLLDTGVCDIRRQNKAGYTPVMLAALLIIDTHAHRDVIKRLFSIGDVNVKSATSGQTALMLAASHGRAEMVELLVECGADVNARDDDGSTALMCACEHGYMAIVQLLLGHPQCDSSLTDVDGSTALSIAIEENFRDIGVLLYAHMNTGRQSSPPAMEHELHNETDEPQHEEQDNM